MQEMLKERSKGQALTHHNGPHNGPSVWPSAVVAPRGPHGPVITQQGLSTHAPSLVFRLDQDRFLPVTGPGELRAPVADMGDGAVTACPVEVDFPLPSHGNTAPLTVLQQRAEPKMGQRQHPRPRPFLTGPIHTAMVWPFHAPGPPRGDFCRGPRLRPGPCTGSHDPTTTRFMTLVAAVFWAQSFNIPRLGSGYSPHCFQ
ncbi:hypothetical protein GWK47_034529 [Chionoecetes opilio]|uniref:Uncharacterized protein n=1 Tax=Chionoecetes opilio TaxID=41210 RepID=A0A8J5D2W6_CHIOP|nr:hypothetical protein GWK47_034529 [Chionoecetes opilio]